jgi:small subunit ribosomal protein S17
VPKRILSGIVTSIKNPKTVTVKVERKFKHPLYMKTVKSYKKYHAHNENGVYKEGDFVQIIESRPFSKTKMWHVVFDDKSKT